MVFNEHGAGSQTQRLVLGRDVAMLVLDLAASFRQHLQNRRQRYVARLVDVGKHRAHVALYLHVGQFGRVLNGAHVAVIDRARGRIGGCRAVELLFRSLRHAVVVAVGAENLVQHIGVARRYAAAFGSLFSHVALVVRIHFRQLSGSRALARNRLRCVVRVVRSVRLICHAVLLEKAPVCDQARLQSERVGRVQHFAQVRHRQHAGLLCA